jgi:23S rRNA pseudouridine1911/1915/1917 synthase
VASQRSTFTVTADDEGLRLDQLLAKHVPGMSRRTARKLIGIGAVFVERARVKVASKTIQPGRKVDVHMGSALDRVTEAEKAPPTIDVVFEDAHLVVVSKPAELITAPTPESDRHNLLHYLGLRPTSPKVFLVHRLDLGTSGLLVFAKDADANRALAELFRVHDVERSYRVAMLGRLDSERLVDEPIDGRPARTRFVPIAQNAGLTLADAHLDTGRTHQIRLHARHLGTPVAGDTRYGRASDHDPPRMALHARVLGFRHPIAGKPLRFERDWPTELEAWWTSLSPKAS